MDNIKWNVSNIFKDVQESRCLYTGNEAQLLWKTITELYVYIYSYLLLVCALEKCLHMCTRKQI